jgi:hypothetical protein
MENESGCGKIRSDDLRVAGTELPFDFCRERRKADFLVETVTLPFFGSSAVPPSQRFETLWF